MPSALEDLHDMQPRCLFLLYHCIFILHLLILDLIWRENPIEIDEKECRSLARYESLYTASAADCETPTQTCSLESNTFLRGKPVTSAVPRQDLLLLLFLQSRDIIVPSPPSNGSKTSSRRCLTEPASPTPAPSRPSSPTPPDLPSQSPDALYKRNSAH